MGGRTQRATEGTDVVLPRQVTSLVGLARTLRQLLRELACMFRWPERSGRMKYVNAIYGGISRGTFEFASSQPFRVPCSQNVQANGACEPILLIGVASHVTYTPN